MTGDDDGSGSGSGSGSGVVTAADIQKDYDDVAASIGVNLSAGELVAMVDSMNMAFGRNPAGFAVTQGTDYQLFDGTRGGLAVQYKTYCRDASMLPVPCDGLEASAHIRPTYSGSLSTSLASMDGVQRTAAWVINDLALPTPRLGGSGTDMFATHLSGSDYTFVVSDTLSKVLFTSTPAVPMGGKIALTVNVQRTRASSDPADRTFDVTASVAFSGTDTATLILDTTHIYSLTLSTGAVVKN